MFSKSKPAPSIGDAELKYRTFGMNLDIHHLAGIQFVAMDDGVVDRFGHGDEDFPVMGFFDTEFLADVVDQAFLGDAFHSGGDLQLSHLWT